MRRLPRQRAFRRGRFFRHFQGEEDVLFADHHDELQVAVAEYVRSVDPETSEADALLAAAAAFGAFMKIPDLVVRGLVDDADAVLARACHVLGTGVR